MWRLGVRCVELGAQSMDERVLELSRRGHSAEDTIRGVRTLREKGFRVGIQLMPGLPGDSPRRFRETISKVIALHPDMVRLYPAVVLRGTELARRFEAGRYRPLTLSAAVDLCAESCARLEARSIPVIRIGLMSSPSLLREGQIVAGPWHTAFGHLVRSRIYLKGIEAHLPPPGSAAQLSIGVSRRDVPLLRGHKNQGLHWIQSLCGARISRVVVDDTLPRGAVTIEAS